MRAAAHASAQPAIRLGLRENLSQFVLLMVVNAFVGAMVGIERSILPLLAEREFHLVARFATLSFIDDSVRTHRDHKSGHLLLSSV